MADQPRQIVALDQLDGFMADQATSTTSEFRAALAKLLPQGTNVPATAYGQWVIQEQTGAWSNPVRPTNASGRLWVAVFDPARLPGHNDGLRAGDMCAGSDGLWIATLVPSTAPATWVMVAGGPGGQPGEPEPGTPGDTSTPSATSRPYALLGSTGTWSSPPGVSLTEALSDGASTSVTGTPISGQATGVSLTLDMTNFAHAAGHSLVVSLVGASAGTAGDVTVTVGSGATTYAAALTRQVGTTAGTITYAWAADALLSLPSEAWRDVEVTITRTSGGLTLQDVVLQSLPPTSPPPAGTDPGDAKSVTWASSSIWYSDLSSAPLAKATAAITAYVRNQVGSGNLRLDAYGDSAPIWMVPGDTPRVNVTPPASSTRGNPSLLSAAFTGVPIPADMPAPSNVFRTAVIVSPETKEVWEFLGLARSGTTWSASWGGKITDHQTSIGAFPTSLGYTGSGLAWMAPTVKVSEARDAAAGNVNAIGHALGLNLNYSSASTAFTWPATRSDGQSTDPGAPRMGSRLRLKANADLSACTPLGKAVGTALKRYGAVIMGGAERISILAQSGASEQAVTGIDPWGSILAGRTVDTVLAGLPLDQLEAVSPGWGGPNWTQEPDTTPVPPPTPPPDPGTNRRAIYMPSGVTWLSGASCRAVEDQADGMGNTFAQWRGEPCHMSRTWADKGGPNGGNDPKLWPLVTRFKNWHASMDEGPGFIGSGESMSAAASGAYVSRWRETLQTARNWWSTRRDPTRVNFFFSPAHEMNGNWYPWSVNSGNYQNFITAWKRYRELQLQYFPEALMCFNANAQSIGANIDWRRMVPGYAEGRVKDFVDVGGCDYYNFTSVTSDSSWNTHINRVDQWGGPWGLERHRLFWEQMGLPMQIPEWSNHKPAGDSPLFADKMNAYMRQHAGVGPGKVCADALFNLSSGYEGQYAVYGDTVGSPNFAARYRAAVWGW